MGGSTSYVRDYEEEKRIQERYEKIINDQNTNWERRTTEEKNAAKAMKDSYDKMLQEQNQRRENEKAEWERHQRDSTQQIKDNYDKIIREQNERRDKEIRERDSRDKKEREHWEAMKLGWQKEKDAAKREAEARIKRDQDAFAKSQENTLKQRKVVEEELKNARKGHEAKMKEIEERTKKEQMEKGKLEEEMKVIRDESIARNKQEKEVEALLKKQEEDRVRMEKEKKDNMEAMEKEMKATQEQREKLQRQMKKALEEEEERKKKEAEREAQQEKLNKQRDEEIRIAREEAEKEAEARRKAEQEKDKAEDDLRKGIRPEMVPTEDDIQRVKAELEYTDDHFHFAICGQAGSGKSSLINALRGMKNTGPGSAKTGAVETTQIIGRYPDMDKRPPRAWIVWYDIPGAGTSNISDWQYFNDQGLFIFDLIILAVGDRLSTIDMWIIKNCRRFNVPCFIVRSKSDQHIRNVAKNELEYDSEDEDQDHKAIKEQARRTFTQQTRQSFASVLVNENLPPQRTYIISASAMCSYINGKPKSIIDEGDLIEDLMQAAYARVGMKLAE